MEKTIEIAGQKVRLKTSGAFPLRFKAQFHKDYFKELVKLIPLVKVADKVDKKDDLQSMVNQLDLIDFDLFYGIVWTMAKTADSSIPEPAEWLDGFDTFPIIDILPQVQEMMTAMITSEKNLQAANLKKEIQ